MAEQAPREAGSSWMRSAARTFRRGICRATGLASAEEMAALRRELFKESDSILLVHKKLSTALREQKKQIEELVLLNRELLTAVGEKGLTGRVKQVNAGVQAAIRRLYVDPAELPPPHNLLAQRFGILSQNAEDGLTWAIFKLAGVTNRRFVEIGSGTNGGNSGFLAEDCGWTGMMVDASVERISKVRARFGSQVAAVSSWVTRENVNAMITEHGFSGEVDLLSIDIDGNDFWVWEAITACSPRLVIVEYNAHFGPDRAVTVPYAEEFDRHRFQDMRYYGTSLAALACLAVRKGYRLVAVEPRGVNAYFLRRDVCPAIPEGRPDSLFRSGEQTKSWKTDVYAVAAQHQLPLVEID